MKCTAWLTIAATALLIPAARGQEANENHPDRAERRQRVLNAFDANGDGELNDAEREKARAELGNHGDRPDRPRGPREDRRPREGREGRPEGPPDPGRMFERFDENHDDQLSRDEFMKLTAELRAMRERWGGGPSGGRGRAGRDDRPGPPLGPPEDGDERPPRRRGDDGNFRPLENPGPPPREEERGYRGREGERGARDRKGPEGRSPERMGPPNPERLFNAFDANHDDQLSREEFMELTSAMRDRMTGLRERGGPPGDGPRRRGRGPDRPDGPPRPPRPPRPDFESSVTPEPAVDGNSV